MNVWLQTKGFDQATAALISSALFLVKIGANPFTSFVSIKALGSTRTLLFFSCFGALAYLSLTILTSNFWVLFFIILASFVTGPMFPLIDEMAASASVGGRGFGLRRLWGSAGFAFGSIIFSFVVFNFPEKFMLIIFANSIIIFLIICMFVNREGKASVSQGSVVTGGDASLSFAIAKFPLAMFLAAGALIQASNAYLYAHSASYWNSHGATSSQVSSYWLIGIASEIVGFLLAPLILKMMTPSKLLLLGAAISCLRWIILGISKTSSLIMLGQTLQFGTIALNSAAVAAIITTLLNKEMRSKAFLLYTTMGSGVFIAIAGWVSFRFSLLGEGYGFYAMAALSALAVLVAASGTQFVSKSLRSVV